MIAPSARMMPWANLRNVFAAVAGSRTVEHALGGERDDPRMPIVRLHELLDGQAHAVDEAELLRDVFLICEGEAVLLPAGPQMQEVPNPP